MQGDLLLHFLLFRGKRIYSKQKINLAISPFTKKNAQFISLLFSPSLPPLPFDAVLRRRLWENRPREDLRGRPLRSRQEFQLLPDPEKEELEKRAMTLQIRQWKRIVRKGNGKPIIVFCLEQSICHNRRTDRQSDRRTNQQKNVKK